MKTILSRRSFVRTSSMGLAATALLPGLHAQAALQAAPVLIHIFLRGGADGLSLMIPRTGYGRQKYDQWRPGSINIPLSSSAAVDKGIALNASFDTHPAMAPLVSGAGSPFGKNHLAFVAGVAGAVMSRSHFMQMDLIESGSSTNVPLASGCLARALDLLGLQEEPLAGVAMNPTVPLSLRGSGAQGIAVVDFQGFGSLPSGNYSADLEWGLDERLDNLNSTASCAITNPTCAAASLATGALDELAGLGAITTPSGDLQGTLLQLAEVIDLADAGQLRVCTIDVGGWDTHTEQADTLAGMFAMVASALRAFHDDAEARGILGRITVVVHSEFGRRADGNGTNGTDHGYGGTALVMDASIKTKVITSGYFPNDAAHAFYSGISEPSPGEEAFLIPKVVDVRQVIGEALRFRLGLTNAQLKDGAGAVFPGYSILDNGSLVLNLI